MGKEQDVHFLIENQGTEEKEICLERLNERMSQELDAKSGKTTVKKSARPFLKCALICIAIAVISTSYSSSVRAKPPSASSFDNI